VLSRTCHNTNDAESDQVDETHSHLKPVVLRDSHNSAR